MSRHDAIAAQALFSALNEFSTRAGHDLLGPLNQAGSLLALFIKRYAGQLDSEADKLLEFLHSASARMEVTVAGVRRYMEVAGKPPHFGPVDLNASLACSLATLEKAITESGAVIISDSLPVVCADAAQMSTIFEVLMGNSIKFRKPDAPPRIQISSMRMGELWGIAVTDNGIGFDPEHNENVFLPFRRLHGTAYAGTGLGLAIAKLIVEMHGGNIRIDPVPEEGNGTCVRFTMRSE